MVKEANMAKQLEKKLGEKNMATDLLPIYMITSLGN